MRQHFLPFALPDTDDSEIAQMALLCLAAAPRHRQFTSLGLPAQPVSAAEPACREVINLPADRPLSPRHLAALFEPGVISPALVR